MHLGEFNNLIYFIAGLAVLGAAILGGLGWMLYKAIWGKKRRENP